MAAERPRACVLRAIDLAHAARAERGDDLVDADPGTGGKGHESGGSIANLAWRRGVQQVRVSMVLYKNVE